jgi:actin-related protein 6
MSGSYIILDNGAYNIKYGTEISNEPNTMYNCSAKLPKQMNIFIGDQIEDIKTDGSSVTYSRPFERGYLNNLTCEVEIWNRLFSKHVMNITPSDCNLILTEAPFTPNSLQNDMNELIYEDFGFKSSLRRPASWFSSYEFSKSNPINTEHPSCCTVIDTGFSFSHSYPFLSNKCQKYACKRVNVGGKLLTNYMKEMVSYRYVNLMDNFKIVEQMKQDITYVSLNFTKELEGSKKSKDTITGERLIPKDAFGNNLRRVFRLPDFATVEKGYWINENHTNDRMEVEQTQQAMMEARRKREFEEQFLVPVDSERFTVPEVLFRPTDVEIDQAGITEATWQSLNTLESVQELGLASSNILLTGGNVNIPQFTERFTEELRTFVPDIFPMKVHAPPNPDKYAWYGAKRYVNDEIKNGNIKKILITKNEYLEQGNDYCNAKFYNQW